jgi:GNAT superfamily N-acetyltransferase
VFPRHGTAATQRARVVAERRRSRGSRQSAAGCSSVRPLPGGSTGPVGWRPTAGTRDVFPSGASAGGRWGEAGVSRFRVRVRTASSDDVEDLVALVGSMTDLGPVRGRRVARSWPDGFRTQVREGAGRPGAPGGGRRGRDRRRSSARPSSPPTPRAACSTRRPVYVSHLLVAPAHRRRGAGRALVSAAAGYAEELGVDRCGGSVRRPGRRNRFSPVGFAPQVIRRIAGVHSLRRAPGSAERRRGDAAAGGRPDRACTRPPVPPGRPR